MGFLPQFLNWQTAAIAAGVAVPSLLLLYFLKLRRQTMPVGSTLLWKKAIQDLQVNSPFQKLRRNLLLLLQLLVLLALLLALARPVSEGTPVAGAKSVIVIDHSASMNARDGEGGQTRLQEARERAKALVGTMSRGSQAMVIAAADDTGTSIVQPFTGDAAALKSAIDSIQPTDRPTRLKQAYQLANANMQFDFDRLRADEAEAADVFLFSDGRVPQSDVLELSLRGRLHYQKVGRDDTTNVAVVAASAKRNYERPTEVQVFARLANYGPEPVDALVRVSVATVEESNVDEPPTFEPVSLRPAEVRLPPARWTDPQWQELNPEAANEARGQAADFQRVESLDVRLELGTSAVIKVELVDPRSLSDALPADDVAYVFVPPPEPLKVALVTEGNYFFELLMQTQPLNEPQIMTPQQYEAAVPEDVGLIIFDNYSPPTLPASGTFVFSGGFPPIDATNVKPVTTEDGVELFYENSEVLDWEREHPMLQGLLLNRIWVSEGRLLTVPLGATMLVEGIEGPMLILEQNGPRTNLIFSFDLMQSTWPRQKTFPYFAYQMFQYLAAGRDVRVRESLKPGESVTVPRSVVDRADLEDGELAVIGPAAQREVRPDDNGVITLGPFDEVGLYRTQPPLPQFERLAVSLLDPEESNLLPNPTDPGNLSGIDPEPAEAGSEGEGDEVARDAEWWWWLVAIAGGVLMLEWLVYTRKVGV